MNTKELEWFLAAGFCLIIVIPIIFYTPYAARGLGIDLLPAISITKPCPDVSPALGAPGPVHRFRPRRRGVTPAPSKVVDFSPHLSLVPSISPRGCTLYPIGPSALQSGCARQPRRPRPLWPSLGTTSTPPATPKIRSQQHLAEPSRRPIQVLILSSKRARRHLTPH